MSVACVQFSRRWRGSAFTVVPASGAASMSGEDTHRERHHLCPGTSVAAVGAEVVGHQYQHAAADPTWAATEGCGGPVRSRPRSNLRIRPEEPLPPRTESNRLPTGAARFGPRWITAVRGLAQGRRSVATGHKR